jgi:type I restriction enzyme S subunit
MSSNPPLDVPLSEVVEVVDYVANGSFASLSANVVYRNTPDYAVLVRLVDFNAGWEGEKVYVDEHAFHFLGKSSLHPGDVLIANVGANAGTVFAAPKLGQHMTLGPNAVALKPRDARRLDRRFLYYYFLGPIGQQQIRSIVAGSAQPKFNKTDLRALRIPLPPMADQLRIVETLSAIDDKIELNRRMDRTLEPIMRAIFESWFVDFDPVRKKMKGKEGGEVGLTPQLAASPLTPLADVAEVVYGAPFSSRLFSSDGVGRPVLRIRDLSTHQPGIFTTESMDRETVVEPGDIVVGMDGEFRAHLWHGEPSLLNQRMCLFRPMQGVPRAFVLESIKAPLAMLELSKTGTTVIHLAKSDIDRFVFPPTETSVLREFEALTEPILDRIVSNAIEAARLTMVRNALLPELIRGPTTTTTSN